VAPRQRKADIPHYAKNKTQKKINTQACIRERREAPMPGRLRGKGKERICRPVNEGEARNERKEAVVDSAPEGKKKKKKKKKH